MLNIFYYCYDLTSVTIPNSVTSIGESTFYRCWCLTSIEIPNSVTSIGESAFEECRCLTSIEIPNSVTSIGARAFYSCYGLTSVTIPNSVTSIGASAFSGCYGLTSVTIPNSVTSIGASAFSGCYGLTSVTISNSMTTIESGTFCWCNGLTSITIPSSVTRIKEDAFYNCTGLTSVTIPNSVTSIGTSAFYGCSGLTSVTIGSGIKTIGSVAFASCPELLDVYCLAEKVPSANNNIFEGSYPSYATLHVPTSLINDYKTTAPWSDFKDIVSLTGDVVEMEKCATPTISYANGKLTFNSATDGAECKYSITNDDIKAGLGNEVQLGVTYNISVYAMKTGYENSETATATLCWIDVAPKTEGIDNGMAQVRANAVLIQSHDNVLNITGAPEDSMISVYNLAGEKVGSAKSVSGSTDVNTSLHSGEVGIVRIGDKAIKVLMK